MESPSTTAELSRIAEGESSRPVWSSQRAYILASIAGVVGLGNLWRFPYMAGQNGGGTFVLAYLICMVAIALPLAVLESSAGNLTDRGPVGTFRRINRRWGPVFGWGLIALTLLIMSYYFVVSGWTLGYAIDSFVGNLRPFDEFTGGMNSLWYFLVISALVLVVTIRGIGGIEKSARVLLPMLVVIVVALAVYAQTLGGAGDGNGFYLRIEPSALASPRLWQMAASQTFYSLGIGQAFLITYGSYIPRGTNALVSTAAVAATNSFISIMAGLMVFPIVFTFGLTPDTGSQLSFTAFPAVFDQIAGGRFIGSAFFVLLCTAAFTSCAGGVVVALAPLRDEFGLSRTKAALLVIGLIVLLGIPSALSFTSVDLQLAGMPFLDLMDQITGSGVVLVAGILGAAFIAWGMERPALVWAMSERMDEVRFWLATKGWTIIVGRFLPVAAVALIIVTSVL
jgi:NSS family neurotransmitter:Na+ symporter